MSTPSKFYRYLNLTLNCFILGMAFSATDAHSFRSPWTDDLEHGYAFPNSALQAWETLQRQMQSPDDYMEMVRNATLSKEACFTLGKLFLTQKITKKKMPNFRAFFGDSTTQKEHGLELLVYAAARGEKRSIAVLNYLDAASHDSTPSRRTFGELRDGMGEALFKALSLKDYPYFLRHRNKIYSFYDRLARENHTPTEVKTYVQFLLGNVIVSPSDEQDVNAPSPQIFPKDNMAEQNLTLARKGRKVSEVSKVSRDEFDTEYLDRRAGRNTWIDDVIRDECDRPIIIYE